MYKKTVLPNGLRVISHDMKPRESAAFGIWVNVGGRYEDDTLKGSAHFLEHILFKGSKKYSCEAIKEEIEGVGGALNAFTSEEQTCYFAKVPNKHLDHSFDILADMVAHPLITAKDVFKERSVILEEIKMYNDLPQYYVMQLLDELMWPDHPLGKNLAGTPDSVTGLKNTDLKQFHLRHYSANHIVVSAAGHIEHQKLVSLAKKKFSQLSSQANIEYIRADNTQAKPKLNLYRKATEQMHLAIGMLGLDHHHPDRYAMALLNVMLGGNMSSRLFDQVREKKGLAYSISSSVKCLSDTGMVLIRAGVDNKKLVDTLTIILKELDKIKKNGVAPDELTRAKDYFMGQLLLGLEDTLDHMLWIGESLIARDKVVSMQEIVASIKKVTLADIKRVAKTLFNPIHYNLAVVGPLEDAQEKQIRVLFGIK